MSPGERTVQAAITYADTTNPGTGYWLKLHLQDGRILQGSCNTPEHGIMRMEIYTEESGINYAEPVWVNLECVSHVQLTW